jgi:SAM-dependent methyltransferase
VSPYPKGFLPDLRRLDSWPDLHDSLWRSPALVRLTYSELARLVETLVGPRPRRVLYVGPGLGYIALELARQGHDVTGVDIDQEAVALATRAAASDPERRQRGKLDYQVGEFPADDGSNGPYDTVLFCRVLHHMNDAGRAVARAADLLQGDGTMVCVDFAHDRFGTADAHWMARSQEWLSRSGWWPRPLNESLLEETERISRAWRKDHDDEGLNPFKTMLDPLREHFELTNLLWRPYLFWDLATDMRAPSDREGLIARFMRDDEERLLGQERLQGVLFSTSGSARTEPAD